MGTKVKEETSNMENNYKVTRKRKRQEEEVGVKDTKKIKKKEIVSKEQSLDSSDDESENVARNLDFDQSNSENSDSGDSESSDTDASNNSDSNNSDSKEVKSSKKGEEDKQEQYDLCRLHVKNLEKKTTKEELRVLFPDAKFIVLPRIKFSKLNVRPAFIEYESEASALEALETQQDTVLHGREIHIQFAVKRDMPSKSEKQKQQADSSSSTPSSQHTLHVAGLTPETTEEHLRSTFNKWPIESIRVPETRQGKKRGFAFILFEDSVDLDAVIETKQNCKLKGGKLCLQKSRQGTSSTVSASSTVFVSGLPEGTTEADLRTLFTSATAIRLPKGTYKDGNKKRFAYVDFSSSEEAEIILKQKEHSDLKGITLKLQLATS